jgi:RimJ/RimL family protein N-acetyltransferase
MEIKCGQFFLRNWRLQDAPAVANYADNRKIWLNLRDGFPHPYTLDHAKQFIHNALAKQPQTFFAIASQQEAIGSIGLDMKQDVHRYTAELGYWLAEPFWNQGIITQAVKAFSAYGFKKFDLIRICAAPYSSNPASARVLEKAGFQYEGRLKASVYKDGKVLDQLMYAKVKQKGLLL